MSMQIARDEESGPVRRKGARAAAIADDEEGLPAEPSYTAADMRPGYLLIPEFSRIGGIKFEKLDGDSKPRRVVKDDPKLEKMSSKIINTANAKITERFAHVPWGYFCEEHEVEEAHDLLRECKKGAAFTNNFAREHNSDRRVRIDLFAVEWDHQDDHFRVRLGEMIARKLIELRKIYTSRNMGAFRVEMDRVRNMEKCLIGEQHKLVLDALTSTIQQRKTMVAMYGDKQPRDWIDPRTGNLKAGIKLDFSPIDKAIKHFCPSWKPPVE